MVLLSNAIGHVSRYGSQFLSPLDVEHLIIKEDVRFDFLQQRPLWSPSQEKSLIDLQTPTTQSLQDASARTGGAAGRDEEGSDRTADALIFDVEFSLELPQGLQETLQRALRGRRASQSQKHNDHRGTANRTGTFVSTINRSEPVT